MLSFTPYAGTSLLDAKVFLQASSASKAVSAADLQPPRPRPRTSSTVARRMLAGALHLPSLQDKVCSCALYACHWNFTCICCTSHYIAQCVYGADESACQPSSDHLHVCCSSHCYSLRVWLQSGQQMPEVHLAAFPGSMITNHVLIHHLCNILDKQSSGPALSLGREHDNFGLCYLDLSLCMLFWYLQRPAIADVQRCQHSIFVGCQCHSAPFCSCGYAGWRTGASN